MIQAISIGKEVSFASSTTFQQKNKSANVNQQNFSTFSKEFATASKNTALASLGIKKSQDVQAVSFKGQEMKKLPEGWIFDLCNMCIKDHYGTEKELTKAQKQEIQETSDFDFKLYCSNRTAKIPFYKYTPICETSKWMPDGYVDVKGYNDLEFVCWQEIKSEFKDD